MHSGKTGKSKTGKKCVSIVRRVGKNRAIVAIARILIETIFSMLSTGYEFIDNIDPLTERKMKSMSQRANSARNTNSYTYIQDAIKLIKDNRFRGSSKELFPIERIRVTSEQSQRDTMQQ
ncbi:conserved hypothetical protein [Metallosphaera cuprina Ar-4]|uniref:Uncharacterized protein n=2 Tax=Metallosphaera TaxID=41980 RepID=F4G1J0_METCR|nr:conserved hypothetical protein [Metallosphaera cuprina Ar-4]